MDRDLKEDQRKTLIYYLKQSIFWIYLFFLVIYGVIMISLLASGSTELTNLKQSEAYILAQESIKQWEKNFVIELTSEEGDCPPGYETLIEHKWAGTVDGCGCDFEAHNVTQTIVVKGKCNSELLGFGCYDIVKQQQIQAKKWKNSKNLCVLRDKSYNMIESLDDKCEVGDLAVKNYKKCGKGSRAVCRDSNAECPISFIQNSDSLIGQGQGKELLISDKIKYTYSSNSDSELPVMNFRFDEYAHCINPNQHNISPNKTGEYILLAERRENCKEEETRTLTIDVIGEEDFYKINSELWDTTKNKLPGYPRPSNLYQYKLSSQPYPYWDFDCRNGDDYSLKKAKSRFQLSNEQDQEDHLLATTITSVVFVSLILIIVEVVKKLRRSKELIQIAQIQSDQKKYQVIMQHIPVMHKSWLNNTIIVIILDKAFKIVNIFSIVIVFIELQTAKDWFEGVESQKCGDTFYNSKIHETYLQSLQEQFQYISAMMGLWLFMVVIDVIFIIFRYFEEIAPIVRILKGQKARILKPKSEDEKRLQNKIFRNKEHEKDDLHDDDFGNDYGDDEGEEKLPEHHTPEKKLSNDDNLIDEEELEMQELDEHQSTPKKKSTQKMSQSSVKKSNKKLI